MGGAAVAVGAVGAVGRGGRGGTGEGVQEGEGPLPPPPILLAGMVSLAMARCDRGPPRRATVVVRVWGGVHLVWTASAAPCP